VAQREADIINIVSGKAILRVSPWPGWDHEVNYRRDGIWKIRAIARKSVMLFGGNDGSLQIHITPGAHLFHRGRRRRSHSRRSTPARMSRV